MVNRILTARGAAPDMVKRIQDGQRVGVMFGPERTGLTSDQVADIVHAIVVGHIQCHTGRG